MTKTTFILSDLHPGAGNHLDDSGLYKSLRHFLETIFKHPGSELMINGDYIYFVSVALDDETASPFSRPGCTEDESLSKLVEEV